MPHPHPGQQWKHGWIPLTAAAAASKNHGRKPGPNSRISALVQEAAAKHKAMGGNVGGKPTGGPSGESRPAGHGERSTGGGNGPAIRSVVARAAEIHKANQERRAADLKKAEASKKPDTPKPPAKASPKSTARSLDDAKAAIKAGDNAKAVNLLTAAMRDASSKEERDAIGKVRADLASKAMGKKPVPAPKPAAKPAPKPAAKPELKPEPKPAKPAKPKLGKKVGEDSRNAPLREGDRVRIIEGKDRGKEGTVTGKGKYGAVKVDVDGKESDMSPANIRSAEAAEASKKAADAIRKAAGRNTPSPETPKPASPGGDGISKVSDDVAEKRIVDAVSDIMPAPGTWVSMTALRRKLGNLDRNQQDRVLRNLLLAGRVDIAPAAIPGDLKPEDHAAAVNIGPKPNHQIRLAR